LSITTHILVIAVLSQQKRLPVSPVAIRVVEAPKSEPLWLVTSLNGPVYRKGQRDSGRPQPIPLSHLIANEPPRPDQADDAAPPPDTEAAVFDVMPDISAPVVRTELKTIPRLEQHEADPAVVPPPVFYSPSANGIGTEEQNKGSLEPARLLKQVLPVYPPEARLARVQGQVVLTAMIAVTGAVENIVVVEGHPLLIAAAVDAVRHWRYEPARLRGIPTRSPLNITVHFRLTFE
jgi:TonB family protein